MFLLRFLGFVFGWMFWFFSSKYRKRFIRNWNLAKSQDKLNKMKWWKIFKAIGCSGYFVFELPKIWCSKNIYKITEVEGIEEIDEVLKKGKGAICLTPHLGSFELSSKIYSKYFPITVMYKPSKNKTLDWILSNYRPSSGVTTVKTNYSGVKSLLKALNNGESIGMLPDQVPLIGSGQWVPFFGSLAYTNVLAMKLALITGAPIVWVLCIQSGSGWKFSLKVWDEFSLSIKEQEIEKILIKMNDHLEKLILDNSSYYMWGYDRYKIPKSNKNI